MKAVRKKLDVVSIDGRGWACPVATVALIRLLDRPGFAVGVQGPWRRDGVGRVWRTLKAARRRASILAHIHRAPIMEAL